MITKWINMIRLMLGVLLSLPCLSLLMLVIMKVLPDKDKLSLAKAIRLDMIAIQRRLESEQSDSESLFDGWD